MPGIRVLVVDDETRIRKMIKEYLSLEEYDVDEASDGIEALLLFQLRTYDIVIMDVMMPQMDGWSACREIRKKSKVPIIMLTARGEEYDKLFGFELGVDDYLVKPFSPKELLARMKAIIRRSRYGHGEEQPWETIQHEGLKVEIESRNVFVDEKPVNLTPKEYELLIHFIKHPNKVFSREQLLNAVWGYDFGGDDRTVDTHIKMLRESLGVYRKLIVTVWGTGYKFSPGVKNTNNTGKAGGEK